MKIYFSGIGGSGISALANLALDAKFEVVGSDQQANSNTEQLEKRNVNFSTDQSGVFLEQSHHQKPIDWFIYTSALDLDHPELLLAQKLGLKISKRDQFIDWFIKEHNLKLIAVAGTHGKTSTTTMLIWLFKNLGIKASHLVGSTLDFAKSGEYHSDSQYFIYEADEYDRNFLHYQPDFSLITSIDWDHVDIYPTEMEYDQAFSDFINNSKQVFLWNKDNHLFFNQTKLNFAKQIDSNLKVLGQHNRQNGQLVLELIQKLGFDLKKSIQILNNSKNAARRFEKLKPGLISDYAHHPTEIKATLQLAKEYQENNDFKQIVAVYEPHQIDRQQQFKDNYQQAFELADQVLWLPTYIARHDDSEPLTASELGVKISQLTEVNFDKKLLELIENHIKQGDLVILMTAGKLDPWIRKNII